MPIRIQADLPAIEVLESENIFVMTHERAALQDIRPLKIAILNLMPTKIETETQLLRLLGNTPLQVDVELLHMASHVSRNTSSYHLNTFYKTFNDVKDQRFDGLIITGAPVEQMPFEEVDYWPELCQIMDWSTTHVHSTLHICWGAQAGLYHHYGIQKYDLPAKASGVFEHYLVKPQSPLVRGFDDRFYAVHSRNTDVRREDVEAEPQLEVVAVSDEVGLYIVKSTDSRRFFVFGHPEYDTDTLRLEYERDVKRGLNPRVPAHYFPNDDPTAEPRNVWRSQAQLLYTNWLNYYVYQTTPYDLARAGEEVTMRKATVNIYELELLEYDLPRIRIRVRCSKGTYIRSLAHEIGQALRSGAHLTSLRRTRSGGFTLEKSYELDEFLENLQKLETK